MHMQCAHAGEAASVASLAPSLLKRRRTEHMHAVEGAALNSSLASAPGVNAPGVNALANAPGVNAPGVNALANGPAATAGCMQASAVPSKRPLPFDAGAIEKRRRVHLWGGASELQGGDGAQDGAAGSVTTTTSLTVAWHAAALDAAAAGPGVIAAAAGPGVIAAASARDLAAGSNLAPNLAAGSNLKRPPGRAPKGRSNLKRPPGRAPKGRSNLKRPPGRAPKGKRWDPRAGWVEVVVEAGWVEEEEEEEKEEEEEEEE